MTVNKDCKYRLPCGWCDKKNELCQYEPTTITGVLDNLLTTTPMQPNLNESVTNDPTCEHEWYCSGADSQGFSYTCRKCHKMKKEKYTDTVTPSTTQPIWINPAAPDINKVGDFPPYNHVTCTSGYINTNECPEEQIDSIIATNITTSAQTDSKKFINKIKSGKLPKTVDKKK